MAGLKVLDRGICGVCGKVAFVDEGIRYCSGCEVITSDCRCLGVELPVR